MIIPGGGTGEVAIFYAEQLNHTSAEIVFLDLSNASIRISQRRARFRNIGNMIWIQSWIEEVRYLGIGLFEHSQCSGVLHHLKRPILGLKIIKDSLVFNGGMSIMVYAEIGRKAVYQVQHILGAVNWSSNVGILKELEVANHTLNILPAHHWFHISSKFLDHKLGNIGIYDLLLHKRDVAFSISSLEKWISTGGLIFVDYNFFKARFKFNIKYYNLDEVLERKIGRQSKTRQWSTTEILLSNVMQHSFFASIDASSEAKLGDLSNRLFIWGNPIGFREAFLNPRNHKILNNKKMFLCQLTSISQHIYSNSNVMQGPLKRKIDVKFTLELNPFSEFLMMSMFKYRNGTGLKSLYLEYSRAYNTTVSEQKFYDLAKIFYTSIKDTGLILLRDALVLPFPKSSLITLYRVTSM